MFTVAGGVLIAAAILAAIPVVVFAVRLFRRVIGPDMTPQQIAAIEASKARYANYEASIAAAGLQTNKKTGL